MSITVTPVRFEHHRDTLGIGEAQPRLSWQTTTASPGWTQTGYELEQLGGDTVAVQSTDSVLVPWPFPPLRSREQRKVRVRVTGADDQRSEWGEWSTVEAGLLEAADWTAHLVGPADDTVAAPLLRADFRTTNAGVVRARVYASGHGLFQLEINGRRIGDDELAPGWTAYESRLRYSTYDVTDLVAAGDNAIGAWLGDGWWRGYLGWGKKNALYGSQLGLIAQLEIDYADGS
ncbi:MAG: alpha-L-rhamnosidase N-terminal domain-containing protein, partial [Microbacterium sp.]